ncbi:MAG: methionyl-tRNA formyltransferase [Anaerolineae bacterium]|jgi:methionyl-tRNA formyltransferase
MSETTRILFMGTPDFALPTLKALIAGGYAIVGVVTQPDRPAGRGRKVQPPPVKSVALTHDLPVFQPKSLRASEAVARLRDWSPEVIVTAATGHILSAKVLAIPTRGTLNVHGSLLPRWRGAAPIQAALLAGDAETGVTIMCTDEGLDTGPILSQKAIPVAPRETAASLHDKLAQLGAHLLLETLPRWLSGELQPQAQPAEGVTIAGRIRKEDGLIYWKRSAREIDRQVRAFTPWPGAYTFWKGRRLKIIEALPSPLQSPPGGGRSPGDVIDVDGMPTVVTGEGTLRLERVQLAGKKALSWETFVCGCADFIGGRLESA